MSVTQKFQNIRGLKCKEHPLTFQKRNFLVISSLIKNAKVIPWDCIVLDFITSLFVAVE